MVLVNNIDKNNISMFSRYNKWYSILQFKHGKNNISQYNFNFRVCDINNKCVILHSYDDINNSIKRSMKIGTDNAKLYISNKDMEFKKCNYIVSPVKNDNEIQIHIIDSRDSDRRVLIHTPIRTYNFITSIKDSINFKLEVENEEYLINISDSKNKNNILSHIKNKLNPDLNTKIIKSNKNIWDEFICADSCLSIRLQSNKQIQINKNMS